MFDLLMTVSKRRFQLKLTSKEGFIVGAADQIIDFSGGINQ